MLLKRNLCNHDFIIHKKMPSFPLFLQKESDGTMKTEQQLFKKRSSRYDHALLLLLGVV